MLRIAVVKGSRIVKIPNISEESTAMEMIVAEIFGQNLCAGNAFCP